MTKTYEKHKKKNFKMYKTAKTTLNLENLRKVFFLHIKYVYEDKYQQENYK